MEGSTPARRVLFGVEGSPNATVMTGYSEPLGMGDSQVVPDLQTGFNLYCTNCRCVNQSIVLTKAGRCDFTHPVRLRGVIDGLYFLCPRCDVVISREMQFCYRCRRPNSEYSSSARKEYMAYVQEWCDAQKPSPPNSSPVLCPILFKPVVRAIVTHPVSTHPTGSAAMANFQRGLDLYCTHCGKNIPDSMLDKPNVIPCEHKFPIGGDPNKPQERDWLYRRCSLCNVVISDEMEYCYRCQSRNTNYLKIARRVQTQRVLEEHRRKKQDAKKESDVFSQDVLSDSDLIALADGVSVTRSQEHVEGGSAMDSVSDIDVKQSAPSCNENPPEYCTTASSEETPAGNVNDTKDLPPVTTMVTPGGVMQLPKAIVTVVEADEDDPMTFDSQRINFDEPSTTAECIPVPPEVVEADSLAAKLLESTGRTRRSRAGKL